MGCRDLFGLQKKTLPMRERMFSSMNFLQYITRNSSEKVLIDRGDGRGKPGQRSCFFRNGGLKEDMSGETGTHGNPTCLLETHHYFNLALSWKN